MSLKKEDATPENLTLEIQTLASRMSLDDISDSRRFPQYFQIETIRHCNAHCTFCFVEIDNNVRFTHGPFLPVFPDPKHP